MLRTDSFLTEAPKRMITGIFQSGEFGYATVGMNVVTNKKSYDRTVEDADLAPFYFMAHVPEKKDCALLLMQRFGVYGIFSSFSKLLKAKFRNSFPDLLLEIEQIVHPDLVNNYATKSYARRVRFRKYNLPSDLAAHLPGGLKASDAYYEVSIVAKKRSNLGVIGDWISKGSQLTGLGSTINFEADETLVDVKLGNSHRTIHINNLANIQCYFDITGKVKKGADGHPIQADLRREFLSLRNDIWRELEKKGGVPA